MASIINTYITNNNIGLKLSGKGRADNYTADNNYDYNGLGISLWSNANSNREIVLLDSLNINNDYTNLRFGIVSNTSKITGNTSIQFNNYLTTLNNRIGLGTTNPYTSLHVKSNIILTGTIVDPNNNLITNNVWTNIGNNLYYNKGFIGIGLTNPSSSLELANSSIILSSNYKIGIGKTNPQNALDVFNNDVKIEDGALFCSLVNSKIGVGNTNPQSSLDVKGDISLSGTLLNLDGTPYVFKTLNPEQWSNSSFNYNNIYYNSGYVGIGVANPSSSLYINGNIRIDGNIINSSGSVFNGSPWNDITINTSNYIYYNNNIGIGTNEPIDLLHLTLINSNLNIRLTDATTNHTSNDGFIIGLDSNQNGFLWNYENASLIFGTSNNERLRITNNGNIGIGTTNPRSLLHLVSSNNSNAFINIDNGLIIGKDSSQNGLVMNSNNTDLFFGTNNEEKLRIKSSNSNIGIGTNNPQSLLHLYKSGGNLLSFNDQGTAVVQIGKTNDSNAIFWNSNNTALTFKTNNIERMRIANNGNIGIGTNNPQSLLHLSATGNTAVNVNLNGLIIGKDSNQNGVILNNDDTSIIFGNNNTEKMRINANLKLPNHNELNTLFNSKKPWAMYFAEDYDNNTTLLDCSGNNRHGTSTGTINKSTTSGNGSDAAINYISGGTSASVLFPTGSIPSTFTILSLSRYTGGTSKRLIVSPNDNWIHGHWAGNRGVCHYIGWNTPNTTIGTLTDWLCCIGKNSGSTPNNILIDGTGRGSVTGGTGNFILGINNDPYGDTSDWAVSCIMVWNTALEDNEMILLNNLINIYKSTGISIRNYILSLFNISVSNNYSYNIGIGINNPQSFVHLYKSGGNLLSFNDQGTTAVQIGKTNDNNAIFWNSNNTALTFKTNNIERMRIANNGNIGIGNNNPLSLLHLSAVTANTVININIDNGLIIGKDSSQNGLLWNSNNTDLIFGTNNEEKLRIKSNSQIGIGTNNPQSLLHLYKSGVNLLSFNDQGTTAVQIGKTNDNNAIFWNSNNTALTFKTNNIERMRIANNGNIGIGNNNPQYLLDVNSDINIEGVLSIGSSSAFISNNNVDNDNTSNTYLILKQAGSTNDWCYIRQLGGVDNYKLSFDFYDNTDSRFTIRYIVPSISADIVKEVFKVDQTYTFANGLGLNGENTTDTIMQTTSNLGITVNNENNNYISFNVGLTNEVMRITNNTININNNSKLYTPTPTNYNTSLITGIYGADTDIIILYKGTALTHPYSIGYNYGAIVGYQYKLYFSIPNNASHKFYINGNEALNINSSSFIIYNNIEIVNPSNPGLVFSFTSFAGSAIGVASSGGSYSSSANSGDMVIRSKAGNKLILQTGANEGHLIINNGRIGIGTDNPSTILDVRKDNIRLSGNIYKSDGTLFTIDKGTMTSISSSNLILRTNIETTLTPTFTDTNNKYYLFEKDGSITFNKAISVDILVVGAGGNGGLGTFSGGGGAGEVIYYPNYTFTPGTYNLTVGNNDYKFDNTINYIKQEIYNSKNNVLNPTIYNLFVTKKPWACYFAEDYYGSTLYDSSGNNRHATTSGGTITKTTASGNGATARITYISGGTSSILTFPTGSIPVNYTILSLTRYTGVTKTRILQADGINWIHGHFDGNRGVCYYGDTFGWITPNVSVGTIDDWLCCIGKNSGTTPGNVLIDGIRRGNATGGTGNGNLRINDGNASGQTSDWALSCVMIWDQALTDQEMIDLNLIINNYKITGFYYSTNRNSIIKLGSREIITAIGGGDGGSSGLFVSIKPWAMYFAEDYDYNILLDSSGNNRHATTTGVIYKVIGMGNGAKEPITYISGDTNSTVTFPSGSIPTIFTILSLTRYTGEAKQRILQGSTINFTHGHLGTWEGKRRGICFYGGWNTNLVSVGILDDWLCCIGKNIGVIPSNTILLDGIPSGIRNNGAGGDSLKINHGAWPNEKSDWALSCVIIWDQALTDNEMANLNTIVNNYLSTGYSIKNSFITKFPTNGGCGGGGYTSNSISVSGATSGLKWNTNYSYVNDGQSGSLLKGGDGGSALINNSYIEQLTQQNFKVGKGGFGISNITYNLFTTKKNYGDGGDGGGGIGAKGVIIIKPNITNSLISTDINTKTLNINNINNSFLTYNAIYPYCSCNVNYLDNSNSGYYLMTSTTTVTFKKDTLVDLLLVAGGGDGGTGINSGGGGAGTVLYFPNYLFTYGTYKIFIDNYAISINNYPSSYGSILIIGSGCKGLSSNINTTENFLGSGGGGYSNLSNGTLPGGTYGSFKTSANTTNFNNSINLSKPYYVYTTSGTNGTITSGGNGGSALSSGGFVEHLTGTNLIVGVGGNGAIGNSAPTTKTTYGSGGDGNGGKGTGAVVIMKFLIEKLNVFSGYQITDDNTYIKTLNNSFTYNNINQLDFTYTKGNVGIGITNPTSLFQVNSNIMLSGNIKNYSQDLIIQTPNSTTIIVGDNSRSNVKISSKLTTFTNHNVSITGNLTVNGNITVTSTCNINIATGGLYKRGGTTLLSSSTNFSDTRIKTNINDINDSNASLLVSAIMPKTYNYIDTTERGFDTVIGFIAQQIKEVIPQSTQVITEFIPNIYKSFINDKDQIITDEDLTLQLSINDKIKFKDNDNYYKTAFITTITSSNLTINKPINGNNCFIYGKEVNDFHTLDKSYIYTTNIGATQDLYKTIKIQEQQLQELNTIVEQQELIFNEISQTLNI